MKCEHCGKHEINYIVDGLRVCNGCKEKSKDNFLIKCELCGTYGYIPRTVHNYARLATLYLIYEGIEVNAVTLNVMIANIQISKPSVVQIESCPTCHYAGEGHA